MKSLSAALLLLASSSAFAYGLQVRSDNPTLSDDDLRAEAERASDAAVGSKIPESKEVYVYVLSRAKPSNSNKYVYFHRVELRRHVHADEPYAFNGWLPIKSVEYYGLADAKGGRKALQDALHEFFRVVKKSD